MGYSLSWIAVKGRTTEDLQRLIGFRSTGKPGNYGEHYLVGRSLQDGWYILIANSSDDPIANNKMLSELSKGGQAIVCSVEEHVMFSSCSFWDKGKKAWSVKHRGDRNVFDLVKSGKVPKSYASLMEELVQKQKAESGENADVDHIFELPLELAKQLVGFRHDQETGDAGDGSYEILELRFLGKVTKVIAASKPWLILISGILLSGVIIAALGDLTRRLIDDIMRFLGITG